MAGHETFSKLMNMMIGKSMPASVVFGTVESVNKENDTCNITLDEDRQLYKVRLKAVIDSNKNKKIEYPERGCYALCVTLDGTNTEAYLLAASEIEETMLQIGAQVLKINKDGLFFNNEKTGFTIDEQGFLLKKENETFAKLMADLIKAIKAMKFTTNSGPTITLINLPEFVALEKRFKTVLKEN